MWPFIIYMIFYITNNEKTTIEIKKGVIQLNSQIDSQINIMHETINNIQETIKSIARNNKSIDCE